MHRPTLYNTQGAQLRDGEPQALATTPNGSLVSRLRFLRLALAGVVGMVLLSTPACAGGGYAADENQGNDAQDDDANQNDNQPADDDDQDDEQENGDDDDDAQDDQGDDDDGDDDDQDDDRGDDQDDLDDNDLDDRDDDGDDDDD